MKIKKILSTLIVYSPLFCFVIFCALSLFKGTNSIADEIESGIHFWTNLFRLSIAIGEIGCLLVMNQFSIVMTGKTSNIADDFLEQDSIEFSVSYNGLIASTVLFLGLGIPYMVYIITKNRILLICLIVLLIALSLGTVINVLSIYLQEKKFVRSSALSKLIDPLILPMVVCVILLLITNTKSVGYFYRNLYAPQKTFVLIITLVVIMCYVLAILFCHFANFYCILAFVFMNKDKERTQERINALQDKKARYDDDLLKATESIDDKASKVCFIRRFGLALSFIFAHLKSYFATRLFAVSYLFLFVNAQLSIWLSKLWEPTRIRNSIIRFCEVCAMSELLLLDMILFVKLGSEDPISRFFELLSTVIIIPILLSSLTNLSTKRQKKTPHGQNTPTSLGACCDPNDGFDPKASKHPK